MIKSIFLATTLLFASSAAASESTHSLGFAAGSTYGVGLSYSYDTPSWGIQITGLPIWHPVDGGRVFGGVNLKRNFHENGKVGLYGSLGLAGGFWKDIDEECTWDEEAQKEDCEQVIDEGWGIASGPGVGMQLIFWDNLRFRFELPLAISYSEKGIGAMPIPNAALMYSW
tara:strand:- start:358 stop:867 length:510 start_codon:yes stop_codon:yes gene_type:complete